MQNRILALALLAFLFSPPSFAGEPKRVCVQFGAKGSCIEMSNSPSGQSYKFSLQTWDLGIGDSYVFETCDRRKIERTEDISHPLKEEISADYSSYGAGVAHAMASLAKSFDQLDFDDQQVEDNFTAIRGRAKEIERKNKEASQKMAGSLRALREQIESINQEVESGLADQKQELEDLNEQIEREIQQNPANSGRKLPNVSMERMEFEAKDELLSDKRQELLKRPSPKLSKEVVDNIYHASGRLQTESRTAYADKDYESAALGQDLAVNLVDFGLGVVPLVGDGIALYEALIGSSPVTGAKLTETDRIISAATGILGLATFGTLGAAARGLIKSSKLFNYSEKAFNTFKKAGTLLKSSTSLGLKAGNEVSNLGSLSKQVLGADRQTFSQLEKIADSAKNVFPKAGDKYAGQLPNLSGTFKEAFEGTIHKGVYKPGEVFFQAMRTGQKAPGRWFTPIKPIDSAHAEELLNINKWGNDAGQLRVFKLKESVSGYAGKVQGGSGHQFLIPGNIPLDEVIEEIVLD